MLLAPATRTYRTWVIDSTRWDQFRPREDDIVISTYPKCGTTWTQRIVGLLVFGSPEPRPIMEISAWLDRRFGDALEAVLARIEAQEHRRFLKAHLPLDGLPFYSQVKYIHVARDGRDACMSFHNHGRGFSAQALARLDSAGLEDETIARPYPRTPADPAAFFHQWVSEEIVLTTSFFHLEETWWAARRSSNVLLVHYNDLKADLSGEMRRIADFLDIAIPADLWPELVSAASFEAMRRDGDALMASVAASFQEGSKRFFHKAENERWRNVVAEEDLALYEAKLAALPPACARWISAGRLATGDPRLVSEGRTRPAVE
jgi:aryl sulfotransferase